jgi:hypothetical protein
MTIWGNLADLDAEERLGISGKARLAVLVVCGSDIAKWGC